MSFREQLELVVSATTAGGEAGLARLAGAAQTADRAATDAGESIARAAQRVAEARAKEADAAGAVRVAEQRLADLRERGVTGGAQYVAAEEKLETARRRQHGTTRELERATEAQTAAERRATDATDDLGDSAHRTGIDLKGLAERAAAFAGGVAIGDWARDAIAGFATMSRDTGQLARSMNATTAEAGAFLGLVGSLGLELGDLLEIQAEFATKTVDGLTLAGTELTRNANGTVNWSDTLVDALAQLQKIPDATERNRIGFGMFGEEGYKQLSRLVNSGVDVREALERIGAPISDSDIAAVADYDAAMFELGLSTGDLGRTLGRAVIPAVTGLVNAGQDLVDVVEEIPLPVAVATAAAIALGQGWISAAGASTLAAAGTARAAEALAIYRYTAQVAGAQAAIAAASMAAVGAAGSAASRGVALLGGPLGVALIGAGTAFAFASSGAERLEERARDAAVELSRVEGAAGGAAGSIRTTANDLEETAGYWERSAAYVKGYQEDLTGFEGVIADVISPFQRLTMGFGDTADTARGFELAIEEAREELGEFGAQQQVAQLAARSLNDMIAEGTVTGDAFAEAVRNAADAQAAESRTTDTATAALAAYRDVTSEAVTTMLELYQAQLGQRSGWQDVLTALQDTAGATEDTETAASEVEQAYIDLMGTVLDYAGASADAAVETQRAAGAILTPLAEAQVRADATVQALRDSLNAPNLTERARGEIQAMIDQLVVAQEKGDITALLSLTGADETAAGIDEATVDRETQIKVESRGGPAVVEYLERITNATRLALIRVESRGGPDVRAYLEGLAIAQRLALIYVESRGGPAVDAYLDSIAAQDRLAIIRVETRGGPDVQRYLDRLAETRRAIIEAAPARGAGLRGAPGAGSYGAAPQVTLGSLTLDLELTGTADRGQLSRAERGRAHIEDIRAYEQRNGTGWRRLP